MYGCMAAAGCFVAQGFLSIPSGFIAVGLVAGPAILFLFAFLCNTTCTMLLEAMARGHLYNMVSFSTTGMPFFVTMGMGV